MLRQRHHLGLSEFNILWRKHPGHFVQQNHAQQYSEYVATLRRAKVLLTDSALVHYSVQKYTEAVMAGCLLVGDIPHDRMREFREIVVEVPSSATTRELSVVVKYWLSHERERLARVQASQRWIMQTGGTDAFFADFIRYYDEARRASSTEAAGKSLPQDPGSTPF